MALPKSASSGESTSVPKSQAASGKRKLPITRSMPAQKSAAATQVMTRAGTSAAMLLPRIILSILAWVASRGSSVRRSRSPPIDCAASRMGRKMGSTRNIGSQLRASTDATLACSPPSWTP